MNPSLYLMFVQGFLRKVVGKLVEKFNGRKEEEKYLHETLLTEEYSGDLTWGSVGLDHSIVAADVVALDSSLPLKSRGTISEAKGKIPKLGAKFRKGESDITNINNMRNRIPGTPEGSARNSLIAKIAAMVLDDVPKCVKAIKVRNEIMFRQALSTGMTLVPDDDNIGTGIRANFGYKHIFHAVTAPWGEKGYNPIEDLRQMFDDATENSDTIEYVYISKKYFDFIRRSIYGKKLVADFRGQIYTNENMLSQPGRSAMKEALADEFGAEFVIITGSFKIENPDGSKKSVQPWVEANIVGVPAKIVGRLVYGTLAEETNKVNGVEYEKFGNYILISKYSKTDPLEEFTAGQALCLPVIDGGDSIYLLHADGTGKVTVNKPTVEFGNEADNTGKKVNVHAETDYEVSQTASTSWLTVTKSDDGKTLTMKVAANATGSARTSTVTLTDENSNTATIVVTQAAALSVSPSSLTFTKNGSSQGKNITVSSDSDFEATANVSWLTLTKNDNKLNVVCEANDAASAPERTATITITSGDGETETVSVTQAANS